MQEARILIARDCVVNIFSTRSCRPSSGSTTLRRNARAVKIRSMELLQISSVEKPIDNPVILRALMPVINRVWAMGVPLPGKGRPFALTLRTLNVLLESARRCGIGRDIATYLEAAPKMVERDPEEAARLFSDLSRAIEASPVPSAEWAPMRELFGDEELEAILGASRPSIARYAKGERRTPDDIADRLHFLTMLVSDLAGAYNDFGIRRWLHRPRSALGGRTPRQSLGKSWRSDSESAQAVRALAAALGEVGAT